MHEIRPIEVLSQDMINKIAAGEVIERPHSIVKELMENAVDAFATKIDVSVCGGGVDEITVTDNGVGFSSQDLPLSIIKNATSKIRTDQDLLSISTNGFRGEALSSISTVSDFEIRTKHAQDTSGFSLSTQGGVSPEIKPAAANQGTRITVKDLFFNVPARKKFLKTPTTEFSHIEKTFKKIALCNPHIHFTLKKDDKIHLNLPIAKDYLQRISQLYPQEITKSLVPFNSSHGPINIQGFGSNTKNNLSRPNEIWLFINGRWIQDRALSKAVMQGYRSILMEHKYPHAFVFISMDPSLFDVNVHPTKSEVRFQDPQGLFRQLQQTIANALSEKIADHQAIFHPRSRSFVPSQRELQKVQAFYGSTQADQSHKAPTPEVAPEPFPSVSASNQKGFFGSLQFLSVLDGTYLICKNSDELILIDQHAAHERVRYEDLQAQWKDQKKVSQTQLIPITLELSPSQLEILSTLKSELQKIGFDWEIFGDKDILLRSIPSVIKENVATEYLMELIHQYEHGEVPKALAQTFDHMLSTLACHSAVRAHDRLTVQEIDHLLTRMDQIDLASYCPHGRPSFIRVGLSDLEKLFKRKV